jgi:small nuclear ribonucleoprotein (snRNP)-like protein
MANETKYEDLALDFYKGLENLLNKFEEVTGKLEDFEETLNETLERISERQYTRDNHELFEG